MMTEMLKDKTLPQAQVLFNYMHAACTGENASAVGIDEDDADRLQALAGVRNYPIRVKCATLAWHTLQAALEGRAEGFNGMTNTISQSALDNMESLEDKIIARIRTVFDPEIPVNLYDLGLIYTVDLKPGRRW